MRSTLALALVLTSCGESTATTTDPLRPPGDASDVLSSTTDADSGREGSASAMDAWSSAPDAGGSDDASDGSTTDGASPSDPSDASDAAASDGAACGVNPLYPDIPCCAQAAGDPWCQVDASTCVWRYTVAQQCPTECELVVCGGSSDRLCTCR